ncbi:putative membrane protein [[Clostridium] bifermentans ATCC 638]|uniref:Putative membrane protein n=1 Tax=Paraclostridium bifermentans ATCC 638 = DSM 14991 TaxID=1233171 RepID=T4VE76_PARBF|nr:putative membrane protein [[Clostridium] bifermentans ATCC 638] [Paraclostridium bifermentans ATCC 638 = DSM 14991]
MEKIKMKNKIVKIMFIVIIVILNLCPAVEAELHRITGWN